DDTRRHFGITEVAVGEARVAVIGLDRLQRVARPRRFRTQLGEFRETRELPWSVDEVAVVMRHEAVRRLRRLEDPLVVCGPEGDTQRVREHPSTLQRERDLQWMAQAD